MTSLEWLDSPGQNPRPDMPPRTVLQELAQLVGMNGKFSWNGFGAVQLGAGPYLRMGLYMEEAVRLVFLSGVMEGLMRAEDGVHQPVIAQRIKDQIQRDAEALRAPQLVGEDGQPLKT